MSIKSIALATAFAMAASVAIAQETRTVEGNYGPIEAPVTPLRVYADGPWTLGNALALGVTPVAALVYGEGNMDYAGDAVKDVQQIPYGDDGVSVETIATLDPDLILVREWEAGAKEEKCKAASNIAATYCYTMTKRTIKQAQDNLLGVADALNKNEEAAELIATMDARIASMKERVLAQGLDKKTVSIMRIRPSRYEFGLYMASVMVQSVGLTIPEGQYAPYPTPADYDSSGEKVSLENLDVTQADYLFLSVDLDNDGQLEALQNNPLYPLLPSVKNNQVFIGQTGVWNSFDYLAMNTVLDYIEDNIIEPAEKAN